MDGSTAKDAFVVLVWSLLSIKCCNEISDEGGKDTCLLYVWSTRGFGTGLVCYWLVGRLPLSSCHSSLCTLSSLSCSCGKSPPLSKRASRLWLLLGGSIA